ncbi:MAG TPA: glycyl-radical enzyme activating protein [Clostridiales bacterium]|nr:glycyl-radical enzyme activating protein [Clostridiales bacterium]
MEDTTKLTGMVFNVERYRIHDGSGIRTSLFLKGCDMACPWCSNPESQRSEKELGVHRNLCKNCGACIGACPQQAVSRAADGTVTTDRALCAACGACVHICPHEAREIYGEIMTVGEVMDGLKKDMAFFMRSGGGVTVSGGEPALQADFVRAVMRECKSECMDTALETCGLANWDAMWKCCEYCDEILFDVKTLVPVQFSRLTAGGIDTRLKALEVVKNNIRALRARDKTVIFRCVIVPGFNDDAAHIKRTADFAEETGVRQIDLLPFHQYGKHKYASLRMDYTLKDVAALPEELLEPFQKQIEQRGLTCTVGG